LSELEEVWAQALADAEARARAAGRSDISQYLALRSSNDLIRTTAGNWLLGLFTSAAGVANRAGAGIQISTEAAYRFKVGNASMVGPQLRLGKGERLLTIAVGWPRVPRDGFISGGGLACGDIKHRGLEDANEVLRLVLRSDGVPSWIVGRNLELSKEASELHPANVQHHLAILLGPSHRPTTRS
jgi:hypothetical protein